MKAPARSRGISRLSRRRITFIIGNYLIGFSFEVIKDFQPG